jgi:cob(I)alamin adenosyltransferase
LLNSLNVKEDKFDVSNRDVPAKGLVEVFTGEGKGKTSAALGMVLRAAGHGLRIHIIFFMKGEFPYGEQKTLAKLPNVTFDRFGFKTFVNPDNIKPEEKQQAKKALETARMAMLSNNYDVLVLDEVNVAASWKLIDVEDIIQLIKEKPESVELILTGRYANPKIVELADLVTEMVKIKHPYDSGLLARKGMDY